MTEVAPSMSQKGQLWWLSWWFCLLSWDNFDRCGIFWLGWLLDIGRYEGVAPSMWALPAWFWRTSGSCAIYAQKGSLMLRKKWASFHLGSPRKTDPTKCQVSFGKLRKKATFRGTWWGRFSRAKQSGKLPERRRLQKIGHSQEHRWRNSHSFANIRLGMSHRWRNTLISPDIHQPT